MKLQERYFDDSGKLVRQVTYDPNPALRAAERLREIEADNRSHWRAVGTVPGWLVTMWLKEAGVKWNDPAANDVLKRKLMDRDWAKFRTSDKVSL